MNRSHTDLKGFKDDASLDQFSLSQDPNVLQHALRLESAVDNNTVPFTNYTMQFKGMIDYIFSTPQSLARLGTLGPFDSNWISQHKIIGSFLSNRILDNKITFFTNCFRVPTPSRTFGSHSDHGTVCHYPDFSSTNSAVAVISFFSFRQSLDSFQSPYSL